MGPPAPLDKGWRDGHEQLALQIIFSFEPRSDLLDHFATFGVVF
jgi:hypothetical protein